MAALNDGAIRDSLRLGQLVIRPTPTWVVPDGKPTIQPASVDLHLSGTLRVFTDTHKIVRIGVDQPGMTREVIIPEDGFTMDPHQFILGSTAEYMELPRDLLGIVNAKSSTGRDGLVMEIAGFVDPGFKGTLTFEMKNEHPAKFVWFEAGISCAQISFWQLTEPALREYGHPDLKSRYQGQQGPTPSYHKIRELLPETDSLLRPEQAAELYRVLERADKEG